MVLLTAHLLLYRGIMVLNPDSEAGLLTDLASCAISIFQYFLSHAVEVFFVSFTLLLLASKLHSSSSVDG